MEREQFIKTISNAKLFDLTQGCSIFTPPWPGEKSLEIHFFKRVTGAYGGGQGAVPVPGEVVGQEAVVVVCLAFPAREVADDFLERQRPAVIQVNAGSSIDSLQAVHFTFFLAFNTICNSHILLL